MSLESNNQTKCIPVTGASAFATLTDWDLTAVEDFIRREGCGVSDAAKAVAEYRKFIFMAISADHPCVPSRDIDEVWHVHMLHSRDYVAFCRAVGRDYIHHEPSLPDEQSDMKPLFSRTTTFYQKVFGMEPDPSIWGSSGNADCGTDPGADCRGTCKHNCQNN